MKVLIACEESQRVKDIPSAVCDDCIWHVCNYNKVDWDGKDGYISKRDALAEFKDGRDVYDIMESIEELPSVDRPTGEWINREKCQVDEDAYEVATCSECGTEITIEYPHDNYCPSCGATMKDGDTCE